MCTSKEYVGATRSYSFLFPIPNPDMHRARILHKFTGKSIAARISFLVLRFFAFPRRSFLAMIICLFLTTAFTMQFLFRRKEGACFCQCFALVSADGETQRQSAATERFATPYNIHK